MHKVLLTKLFSKFESIGILLVLLKHFIKFILLKQYVYIIVKQYLFLNKIFGK